MGNTENVWETGEGRNRARTEKEGERGRRDMGGTENVWETGEGRNRARTGKGGRRGERKERHGGHGECMRDRKGKEQEKEGEGERGRRDMGDTENV